jgi:hypothetical protein
VHTSLLPYGPHARPNPFFSILPPAQYWRNTDHSAPNYVTFSNLLSPRLS